MAAHQRFYGVLIMRPFRVLLSNNQLLFSQSIKKNLEENPDIKVIIQIVAGHELLPILKKSRTDMVILDIYSRHQFEIVEQIKSGYPKVKILILTMTKSKKLLLRAILANVDGYMLKENTYSDLVNAIKNILQGGSYFCNTISGKMADIIRDKISSKNVQKALSPKQLKILNLRCESKSYKEIAEILSLNYNTVTNYMAIIMKKLNLKTQNDLIKYCIEEGHISYINVENER
jgi:DNA-binding NarL/FixJ family response regulator